jgi:hypothetical protein
MRCHSMPRVSRFMSQARFFLGKYHNLCQNENFPGKCPSLYRGCDFSPENITIRIRKQFPREMFCGKHLNLYQKETFSREMSQFMPKNAIFSGKCLGISRGAIFLGKCHNLYQKCGVFLGKCLHLDKNAIFRGKGVNVCQKCDLP